MGFIKKVSQEVGKVTWLSSKEVWLQLLFVVLFSALLLGYFGIIDYVVVTIKDMWKGL